MPPVLHLHVIHPADDVQHLLEDPLQGQVLIQTPSSSLQKLLQVVPQAQDVVFPHVDPFGIMVSLGLQLLRDVHQGLYTFLVRGDVRLNGIVLFLRRLHCWKVITKVILRRGEKKVLFMRQWNTFTFYILGKNKH